VFFPSVVRENLYSNLIDSDCANSVIICPHSVPKQISCVTVLKQRDFASVITERQILKHLFKCLHIMTVKNDCTILAGYMNYVLHNSHRISLSFFFFTMVQQSVVGQVLLMVEASPSNWPHSVGVL